MIETRNLIRVLFGALVLFNLPVEFIMAQTCLPNGITFTSQAELNDFPNQYPNCNYVAGDLIIQESFQDDITDLSPLAQLDSIGGKLYLFFNPSVASLSGLHNLQKIGGMLYVYDMEALTDMTGLNSLERIDGDIYIAQNNSLVSLNGLQNLTSIGGYIYMGYNYALTSIEALMSLQSMGGRIELVYNSSLTSLSGLDNIDHTTITELTLINATLSYCNVLSICNYLADQNNTASIFNASGCANRNEVETNCQLVGMGMVEPTTRFSAYWNSNNRTLITHCTEMDNLPVSLSIHSTDGKIISKQPWAPELRMSGLSSGVYILSIELEDGSPAYMRVLIP